MATAQLAGFDAQATSVGEIPAPHVISTIPHGGLQQGKQMNSREFCYWLQGLFELSAADMNKAGTNESLSREQTAVIRRHLDMVFKHEIDPSYGDKEKQEALNKLHHPQFGPQSGDVLLRC